MSVRPVSAGPVILTGILAVLWSASAASAAVVSSFGTGSSSSVLSNNGDSALFGGAFIDTATFGPTTNPAYSGAIGVTVGYNEPVANDASVTVSGEPLSLKFASGAGASFTSPSDYNLTVTVSFAAIGAGYLPSSTWFSVLDLDGNSINGPVGSRIYTLTALDASGTVITTPWLGAPLNYDFGPDATTSQPPPGPSDYAVMSGSGGVYTYQGAVTATATPVTAAQLTQNVSAIRFNYFGSTMDNTQINFSDTPIIPEPSAPLLAGMTALLAGWRRRRPAPGR